MASSGTHGLGTDLVSERKGTRRAMRSAAQRRRWASLAWFATSAVTMACGSAPERTPEAEQGVAASAITNSTSAPTDANVMAISYLTQYIDLFGQPKLRLHRCSAVLVTPTRLLTAAHCFRGTIDFAAAIPPIATSPPYQLGAAVRVENTAQAVMDGNPSASDVASLQYSVLFPAEPVAWPPPGQMDFFNILTPENDLAVVPLSRRIPLSQVAPAQLPFGPSGPATTCSSTFPGRILGYSSYWRTQASVPVKYRYGGVYRSTEYTLDEVLPELPYIGPVFQPLVDKLLDSATAHLLEGGDSGGPLFQGPTVCGVNSATLADTSVQPLYPDPPWPVPDPPIPIGYLIELTAFNAYARTDTEGAASFIRSNIVDSAGNFHGTCPPGTPAALADGDTDGDFIPDGCDPCPRVRDPDYAWSGQISLHPYIDQNGQPRDDTDGDGVPDVCDSCPDMKNPRVVSATGSAWEQPDADGDGIGDACDRCPGSPASVPWENGVVSCCNTDADCGNVYGTGKNRCYPLLPSVPPPGWSVPLCAGFYGRCSWQADQDYDFVGDECDNCPSDDNEDQSDHDQDGAGDVCDNCSGLHSHGPQLADRNDIPPTMHCTTDADCQLIHPQGECVPRGKIFPPEVRRCTKFADPDQDGVGSACDSCPGTTNPLQANCNLDAELANLETYPFRGDACEPNPCPRAFEKMSQLQQTATHLWLNLSWNPQALPNGAPPQLPNNQATFDSDYTGSPSARVGARFCPCSFQDPKQAVSPQACKVQCPLSASEYDLPSAQTFWTKPALLLTPPPGQLPAAPTAADFPADFPGLPLEAAREAPWSTADNLLPTYGATQFVSWDLTFDQAGSVPGYDGFVIAKLGVLWSAVRDVPVMKSPASAFLDYSNHYYASLFGLQTNLVLDGKQALASCFWCQVDPCPQCKTWMEIGNLLIDPILKQVVVQSAQQSADITAAFSTAALERLTQPGLRWVQVAEREHDLRSGDVGLVGLTPDGASVVTALARVGTLVQPVLGTRTGDAIDLSAAAGVADLSGPAPRTGFGVVASAREHALFVVGGKLASTGELAHDLWRFDLVRKTWRELPIVGPKPRQVVAATYLAAERSLLLLDEGNTEPAHQARLLRYHVPSGKLSVLGAWPRSPLVDRVELGAAPGGRLLLTGSSAKLARVVGVVLDLSGGKVSVLAGFEHPGVLALEPTLTERALALPLVSSGPTGVENAVLGTDALFAGAYEAKPSPKGKGKGKGKPISVSDAL